MQTNLCMQTTWMNFSTYIQTWKNRNDKLFLSSFSHSKDKIVKITLFQEQCFASLIDFMEIQQVFALKFSLMRYWTNKYIIRFWINLSLCIFPNEFSNISLRSIKEIFKIHFHPTSFYTYKGKHIIACGSTKMFVLVNDIWSSNPKAYIFCILKLSKTSTLVLLAVSQINCDLGLFSCFSPKYALGKHRRYYLPCCKSCWHCSFRWKGGEIYEHVLFILALSLFISLHT